MLIMYTVVLVVIMWYSGTSAHNVGTVVLVLIMWYSGTSAHNVVQWY